MRTLPVEILSLELRLEVSDVVDLERVAGVELLVAELTDQVVKYITNNTYNNYQLINLLIVSKAPAALLLSPRDDLGELGTVRPSSVNMDQST